MKIIQTQPELQPSATTEEQIATCSAEWFAAGRLLDGVLTAPRLRESVLKVEIKPVLLRGERKYQFAYHQARKVTHRNLTAEEAQTELIALLLNQFRQGTFHTQAGRTHILLNKRNEASIRTEQRSQEEKKRRREEKETGETQDTKDRVQEGKSLSTINYQSSTLPHDRARNHILPEGQPVPFLVALGVMSADGKVIAARRDKFRQINRFLEMVADVTEPLLERADRFPERPLQIVDFGCGKGYLTFALYHYLHHLRGLNIRLVGVDLKRDVLAQLSALAAELNYNGLSFVVGDIRNTRIEMVTEDGEGKRKEPANAQRSTLNSQLDVNLVVALHACDTATDDALAKAVAWGAQVILAAPCCQHELFSKIQNEALQPMLRHGIARERLNALVTDTLRAELLSAYGYQVQMLEFIDAEHTPKNLLIRAVRRANPKEEATGVSRLENSAYAQLRDFWQVQPYMEQAFREAMSNENAGGSRQYS